MIYPVCQKEGRLRFSVTRTRGENYIMLWQTAPLIAAAQNRRIWGTQVLAREDFNRPAVAQIAKPA